MLKNYLKTAFRNLRRQKGYSFLNVVGLTLGMACCLLLFQYVAYETSYDDFNTKKDRIYRSTFETTRNGEDLGFSGTQGYIYGPTVAAEVPGIARYARIHPNYGDAVISYQSPSDDRTFKEPNVFFVDSTFLSIFDYPLIRGDRSQALREPLTMLLTESMARKYFGTENPIGKSLEFTGWIDTTYTVAGVLEDVPSTSHMQFDFLLPMEDLLEDGRFEQGGAPWGWQNFVTHLELEPNADPKAIEAKITELYAKYRADDFSSQNMTAKAYLQPLLDVHLNREIQAPAAVTGDRKTVYFLTIIGLVTLVIALVNYVNLATARALDRAKEVGVRKVVGAQRNQLVGQFLMESALLNVLALALAIGLSFLLLPVVNQVAETQMTMDLWLDGRFWAVFLGIFGVGALLSGLYPAFILSSFKPVVVLKGKVGALTSRVALRKVLVVVQFAASIALLAGTAVVYSQISYMRGLDTGLELEQVLVVEGPRIRDEGADRQEEMKTLKTELRKIPGVGATAVSGTTPGRGFYFYSNRWRANADPSTAQDIRGTSIDHDFAEVYELELVAGEAFYEGMTRPDSGAQPVMVNEAMVRAMGFASNEEAVNQNIVNGPPGEIIRGVYKDFQWSSAHEEKEAVMFIYQPGGGNISMKVSVADAAQIIAAVEKTYAALFPGGGPRGLLLYEGMAGGLRVPHRTRPRRLPACRRHGAAHRPRDGELSGYQGGGG
jgi:putative ABC transport system permease protein